MKKQRRDIKAKIEFARFLHKAIENMAVTSTKEGNSADGKKDILLDFSEFINRVGSTS